MTSVSNTSNGVPEEKTYDAFNVSQGKEALDLEDSFQSIGSPPSLDTQSNSDGVETTADLSGESSLPSPDSAIGGTPGVTPDIESPLYQSPIGKLIGEERDLGGKTGRDSSVNVTNDAPGKELLYKELTHPPKASQTVVEKVMGDQEDEEDADTPESETASTGSSSSSSLLVMEKDGRVVTDNTQVQAPVLSLIDYEYNTEESISEGAVSANIIDSIEAQPLSSVQVPLMPSPVVKKDSLFTMGEPTSLGEAPRNINQLEGLLESPGKKPIVTSLADVEEFVADVLESSKATAEKRGERIGINLGDNSGKQVHDHKTEEPMLKEISTNIQKMEEITNTPFLDDISYTKGETSTALSLKDKASTVTDPDPDSADVLPETPTMVLDREFTLEVAGCPNKQSTPLTSIIIPEIKVDQEDDGITEEDKKQSLEDTPTEEEEKKVSTVKAPPEVKDDRIEDGGYEEDEENEDGEDEDCDLLSDSEMVVEASMKFPLANKANGQEVPVEEKLASSVAEESSIAEPVSEIAVQMNVQVTQTPLKETTPSGCESDVEDNDQDDSTEASLEDPIVASNSTRLTAPTNRIPASIELPETVVRLDTPQGSSVFLVGTAHFSRESQDDVANTIKAVKPDIVVVELCKARTAILQLDEETILEESRSLDFRKVQMILRQHGKVQGVLYLLLLSVSAHITKQLGMAPGGEFRTAFSEAKRSAPGCLIQFGDRPIQVTLSRALASLSLWHKVKLTWHILTSKEPISKEEVEKCKQRDFIEEMLAEMTGQFPAISEVFVKERDIYLCRSLQAAAQPVPNPMSPSGIAPRIVVGVVGIGHVPGIVERWGKVTDDDIPPIMKIPPTSLSTQVLKFTLKVTFYGLLGYGVYKLLPSSTKASAQSMVKAVADSLPQKWLK